MIHMLEESLLHTADWRRQKAQDYPDDQRNLEAAELLERLAAGAGDLQGTDLERRYTGIVESWGDHPRADVLSEIESEALKAVGFRSFPGTSIEFVENLVANLEEICPAPENPRIQTGTVRDLPPPGEIIQ